MNGWLARRLFSWMYRASISLPVPVSPKIITVDWRTAMPFAARLSSSIGWLSPTSRSVAFNGPNPEPFDDAPTGANADPLVSIFGNHHGVIPLFG